MHKLTPENYIDNNYAKLSKKTTKVVKMLNNDEIKTLSRIVTRHKTYQKRNKRYFDFNEYVYQIALKIHYKV